MTVVSSKEFAANQKKVYDIALNERVIIRRGRNFFYLTGGNINDDSTENDYNDLIEAKAYAKDTDTSLADFKKYICELAK